MILVAAVVITPRSEEERLFRLQLQARLDTDTPPVSQTFLLLLLLLPVRRAFTAAEQQLPLYPSVWL